MDAVVFDWDGTLVDTLPAITKANAEVLGSYGVRYDDAAYRAAYSPDWRGMYRRLGVPAAEIEAAGGRWLEAYRALMGEARAFPGVADALAALRRAGYVMGLVTAGDRRVVEHQLDSTGLGELLPVRVCGDDMPFAKPHPAPLLRALGELGLIARPERAIYVGDAPDDMRMARSVGARGIGIESILGERGDLAAAGASEVAASVTAWVAAFLGTAAGR
ncbi:MAG: HAD-IA family hydrolase [Chloroflexi bacterium]|nr:HAD-IA family hydrolase [Chloroflexota bacterium]